MKLRPFFVDLFLACLFVQVFVVGKVSELLVGLKHNGESKVVIIAIICSIHLRTDHERIVQKLMPQTFVNLGVPPSTTGTIPYVFVISKDLQVGKYNLVGTIYYILDHQPSQSIFYNGTIEIVEIHGIIRVRTVILITLIFSFIFCLWRGCVLLFRERNDKKKAKKAQEEAEWRELLAPQKTAAVTESSSKKKNKSKKKK